MAARRVLGVVMCFALSCSGRPAPEQTTTKESAASIAVARLRAVPVLGARLDAATELLPTRFGFSSAAPGAVSAIVPPTARAPLHVGRDSDRYVEIVAEHETDVRGTIESNAMVYPDVSRDTDAFIVAERDRIEEIRVLRSAAAPTVARYRVRLGPGLSSLRLQSGHLEALDAKGRAWLRTEPMFAVDADGRRVVPNVAVQRIGDTFAVAVSLDVTGLRYPIALDPAWGSTAAMSVPRQGLAGAKLGDGRILVFGGNSSTFTTTSSTAEIYDPGTGTWTLTGSMGVPRGYPGAALIAGGKVMALGGQTGGTTCTAQSTSEVWDPTAGTWSAGPALPLIMADPNVQVLAGNKVAMFGGNANCTGGWYAGTGYVLDVAAGTWATSINNHSMYGARLQSSVLPSGRVLLTGATAAGANAAHTFDATTMAFSPAAMPAVTRALSTQLTLASGKVLVAGANNGGTQTFTAELFDPMTATWSTVANMPAVRFSARAVVLTTGKALIGTGPSSTTDAYSYDSVANAWSIAGALSATRSAYLMFSVAGGGAVVIGGTVASAPTATVELMADGVANGGKCTSNGMCASGFCSDGACCGEACTGKCESCNQTGSVGICVALSTPLPGDGVCDPYVCGVTNCKTACTVDADCIATSYCNTTTSACVPRVAKGAACTTASQCTTGMCFDGVCCNSVCDGACVSCNESGSLGDCVTLSGVPDKHAKCPAGECTSTCLAGACAFKAVATPCGGASTCTGNTLTAAGKCSGTDERCLPGGTAACPGSLVCADATTCKSKCSSDADCIGSKCDLASGACGAVTMTDAGVDVGTGVDVGIGVADGGTKLPDLPTVTSEFVRCSKNADCPSGHCVDDVCCDTACNDKCHSCALTTSPGKCTMAPIGVDLRSECGPARQCLGTCDGAGQCIGAGNGTMCARNRCTSQGGGVGPAYCPGPGGVCNLDAVVPFNCSPFVCEPAFGACRTSCATSLECVNGFVCDLAAKSCVAVAAPVDEGGCALGRGSTGAPAGALIALLAVLGRIRRRRATV